MTHIAILFTLIISCLLLPQAKALAATYYVDIDGVGPDGIPGTADDVVSSDANPGTFEQPWKTLARAYTWYSGAGAKVAEGDTVLFRNGSYGEFKESTRDNQPWRNRSNWVKYCADSGHNPEFSNIYIYNANLAEYPHLNEPYAWGHSYLWFEGINILDGVAFYNAKQLKLVNCTVKSQAENVSGYYAPYFKFNDDYAVDVRYVNNITIENCEVSHCFKGIYVGSGEYVTIKNNNIHYIAGDGLSLGASDMTIEGNYIHDGDCRRTSVGLEGTINGTFIPGEEVRQEVTNATGIVDYTTPTRLYAYITSQTGWGGANYPPGGTITGQTSGATISDITTVDPIHTDLIEIMAYGAAVNNLIVRNNIGIRVLAYPTEYTQNGWGFKLDSQAPNGFVNALIENNLIVNDGHILLTVGEGPVYLYNNTFYTHYARIHLPTYSPNSVIERMYNNIFSDFWLDSDAHGCYTRVVNHGNNIFRANPNGTGGPSYPFAVNSTELVDYDINTLFVDAANGDFRLAESSVAIDFGDPANAPATDILGNLRDSKPDAGCYEYGASTFLYGDVSENGEISAYDAALTAQYSVGLITLTPDQIKAADVSGNGEVSAYDAALIAQRAVGIIDKFPVEP